MAASNKALLAVLTNRTNGEPSADVMCAGLIRLVSKAEAFDLAGNDHWLGIHLTLIEDRLDALCAIRDALLVAKAEAA